MRTGVTRPGVVVQRRRLDARYFLSPGLQAMMRLDLAREAGLRLEPLKDIGRCWHPNRFKRTYAVAGEDSLPYLRPYDVFNYMPVAADWLSKTKTESLSTYLLTSGMLLQTASGRNLGPAVAVDSYIAKFILGDDMIRVEIEKELERYFVLSFMKSSTGQRLYQRHKTGSVIDHVSPVQLANQLIPRFDKSVEQRIAGKMRDAVRTRERARDTIQRAFDAYEERLPKVSRKIPKKNGWTVRAAALHGRLDAAPSEPILDEIRRSLESMGGLELDQYAEIIKPAGRYKTRYVEKEYGVPILSGTQALQATPIKLQHIAEGTLHEASRYSLRTGTIVFQADGRAEEGLGFPAVVTPDRDGWFASGHVGRLVPKKGIDSGWLYLAVRSDCVQAQLRALACGSVVDALYEEDIRRVVLPPPESDATGVLGAWKLFTTAQSLEDEAISDFERSLSDAIGDAPP